MHIDGGPGAVRVSLCAIDLIDRQERNDVSFAFWKTSNVRGDGWNAGQLRLGCDDALCLFLLGRQDEDRDAVEGRLHTRDGIEHPICP